MPEICSTPPYNVLRFLTKGTMQGRLATITEKFVSVCVQTKNSSCRIVGFAVKPEVEKVLRRKAMGMIALGVRLS